MTIAVRKTKFAGRETLATQMAMRGGVELTLARGYLGLSEALVTKFTTSCVIVSDITWSA